MSSTHLRGARWLSLLACLLPVCLLSACASLPERMNGAFVERTLDFDGLPHRYQVFVPGEQAGGRHPPVILFLHGTGERGSDGLKPTLVGLGPHLRQHAATFPAIVVFPQAPEGNDWKGIAADIAFAALDAATREFRGDSDRTYLTGMSMGGYGTWELALLQPHRFAALVPVCGGLLVPRAERDLFVTPVAGAVDPYALVASRIGHLPIWMFHGAQDDVVPPRDARLTHAALLAAGAHAHYTEFPEANHNAWDPAYAQTRELWTWLFAQRR
jgi:predicted peptidase